MSIKPVLTIEEFCEEYGIGRSYAYLQIRAGKLPTKKAGKRTLILRGEADAWLEALPNGQQAA
ncbi:helix-turn-helix domain-containing protein [Phyllobacterium sp. SB3]|uniref:helix-turn-helix domain-containing protein n=1 Tax=Phyllobacterium sp. SB3 TaxID=3156073 RepID=UPI0032AF8361